MMTGVGVETNQHVQLSYQPATLFERILAFVIDVIMIGIYAFVVNKLWYDITPEDFEFQQSSSWILYIIIWLPLMLYHLLMETLWKGFSIGKKLVGIRVTRIDGKRPQISNYIVRWLFRSIEITFSGGLLAMMTILLNGKGQRIGDIVANTTVVKYGRKVTLNDTILAELDLDYTPVFPQMIELTDADVTIIRDVLAARKDYEQGAWIKMLERTRRLVEQKTGATDNTMDTVEFLRTVIRDYNALHGSLE